MGRLGLVSVSSLMVTRKVILAKKVKKRYKISNLLIITVKADDATFEVVGGKNNLENRQRKFQKIAEAARTGEVTDIFSY